MMMDVDLEDFITEGGGGPLMTKKTRADGSLSPLKRINEICLIASPSRTLIHNLPEKSPNNESRASLTLPELIDHSALSRSKIKIDQSAFKKRPIEENVRSSFIKSALSSNQNIQSSHQNLQTTPQNLNQSPSPMATSNDLNPFSRNEKLGRFSTQRARAASTIVEKLPSQTNILMLNHNSANNSILPSVL